MSTDPLSLPFLRDMGTWAMRLALGAAVLGALITRDWRFPLSVAIGAAVDISLMELAVSRASSAGPDGIAAESQITPVLIAGRLLAKAILLLAAVAFPAFLSVWGMVVGVLVLDVTIMTVGSVKAVATMQR